MEKEKEKEYVVPVFFTVAARSAQAAWQAVLDILEQESLDLPPSFTCVCLGNEDEIKEGEQG